MTMILWYLLWVLIVALSILIAWRIDGDTPEKLPTEDWILLVILSVFTLAGTVFVMFKLGIMSIWPQLKKERHYK